MSWAEEIDGVLDGYETEPEFSVREMRERHFLARKALEKAVSEGSRSAIAAWRRRVDYLARRLPAPHPVVHGGARRERPGARRQERARRRRERAPIGPPPRAPGLGFARWPVFDTTAPLPPPPAPEEAAALPALAADGTLQPVTLTQALDQVDAGAGTDALQNWLANPSWAALPAAPPALEHYASSDASFHDVDPHFDADMYEGLDMPDPVGDANYNPVLETLLATGALDLDGPPEAPPVFARQPTGNPEDDNGPPGPPVFARRETGNPEDENDPTEPMDGGRLRRRRGYGLSGAGLHQRFLGRGYRGGGIGSFFHNDYAAALHSSFPRSHFDERGKGNQLYVGGRRVYGATRL